MLDKGECASNMGQRWPFSALSKDAQIKLNEEECVSGMEQALKVAIIM